MTRHVVPRIHDYDSGGLNDVLERWNKYHLGRLPADVGKDQLESFLVECLTEKGIVIDPRLLEWKKSGLDLLKVSDIPGTKLIEIEREKLSFVWRWADYLFPDWGYWLEFPTLPIEAAVYLASDVDPSFSDARKRNPPYDEQNLHYKSWFDEPMNGKEWRYVRPMIEKRVESRLQIAAMNFEHLGGELKMALPERGFLGTETPVKMHDFVEWAIDCKDWELPQELVDRFYAPPVKQQESASNSLPDKTYDFVSIPTPYADDRLYERKVVGRYLKHAFPERFTGDAQLTFDSLTVVDVPYQKVVSIGGVGNPNYRQTATRHRYCLKGCDINQFISDFLIKRPSVSPEVIQKELSDKNIHKNKPLWKSIVPATMENITEWLGNNIGSKPMTRNRASVREYLIECREKMGFVFGERLPVVFVQAIDEYASKHGVYKTVMQQIRKEKEIRVVSENLGE